jgi:putative endonuclease
MFVYILRSPSTGKEYVGMSKNPNVRLEDHNHGRVTSTRPYRPWVKIYEEICADRIEARKREKYLKSAAGRTWRKTLKNRAENE